MTDDEHTFIGQHGVKWKYWNSQLLGKPGGFGGVYAAEGPDGKPMAVKVVRKAHPSGMLDDRLLRREISIGRKVAESGSSMLLPVIDAADTADALLLVMSRAGESLDDTLSMGEDEIIAAMTDIVIGLQNLHSIGVIHRDLKPPNVLRHDGHWKLADFGIARDQELGTQNPTFSGWGSLPYMAPELWQLMSPTVKTDLYALGCLGFELLTGAPPYGRDETMLRAAHLTRQLPDVPCANGTLKNLISRLIAKNPEERPQDARAVLDRLRRAVLHTPLQQELARSLNSHDAERSRVYVQSMATKYYEEKLGRQISQAWADLREIYTDTLEDLQAVEPNAIFQEAMEVEDPDASYYQSLYGRPHQIDKWGMRNPPAPSPSTTLSLSVNDIALRMHIWNNADTHGSWLAGDTILLAGCIYITNHRCFRDFNAANIAYQRGDGSHRWIVYRFCNNSVPHPIPEELGVCRDIEKKYGALAFAIAKCSWYDRFIDPLGTYHGLGQTDFRRDAVRDGMLHPVDSRAWRMTVAPLNANALLQLFKEAADLGTDVFQAGLPTDELPRRTRWSIGRIFKLLEFLAWTEFGIGEFALRIWIDDLSYVIYQRGLRSRLTPRQSLSVFR
jgi:serine/threonine protein kinase